MVLMEQIRRTETDFLKSEHFAILVVCDSVHSPLDQNPHKDSEEGGGIQLYIVQARKKTKNIHHSISDDVDSTIAKENSPNPFTEKERKECYFLLHQVKAQVHFDNP